MLAGDIAQQSYDLLRNGCWACGGDGEAVATASWAIGAGDIASTLERGLQPYSLLQGPLTNARELLSMEDVTRLMGCGVVELLWWGGRLIVLAVSVDPKFEVREVKTFTLAY